MFAKIQEALRRRKIGINDLGIVMALFSYITDWVNGHSDRLSADMACVILWLVVIKLAEIEKKLPPTKEEIEDAYRAATRDGWRPPRRKTG